LDGAECAPPPVGDKYAPPEPVGFGFVPPEPPEARFAVSKSVMCKSPENKGKRIIAEEGLDIGRLTA
jgi:hypothetical protein